MSKTLALSMRVEDHSWFGTQKKSSHLRKGRHLFDFEWNLIRPDKGVGHQKPCSGIWIVEICICKWNMNCRAQMLGQDSSGKKQPNELEDTSTGAGNSGDEKGGKELANKHITTEPIIQSTEFRLKPSKRWMGKSQV